MDQANSVTTGLSVTLPCTTWVRASRKFTLRNT